MGNKRRANKEGKGRSGSKNHQQRKKTTALRENTSSKQGAARLPYWVASCLTWWPFLSVYILLMVMMYGLMGSATSGAALSALKSTVLATLPDLALRQIIGQISSVAMVTAAAVAALAENACGPSHKHKHTSTGTGAMHQALTAAVKLVLYNGAGLLFAACTHAVATSSLFWRVCKEICSQMSPVPTEVQAVLFTLAFAGLCTLLQEFPTPSSSMGQHIRTAIASLTEAAIVCSKLVSYTLLPMLLLVVANGMRKDMIVWIAKAGFDVLALEMRMRELLPVFLMVVMITALVLEGCFVLTFKCMSPDSTVAGRVASAMRATFSQPGHKQALILGVKLVLYTGAGLLFAGCIHAVGTSPLFWHMCKEVCSHMWSASAEVQAFFVTLTFAGFCALLEEVMSPNSSLGQQISTAIGSLMEAADVFLKMTCYVVIPVASVDLANSMRKRHLVQSVEAEFLLGLESRLGEVLPAFLMIATITALVAEGCYVLYSKRMSPHFNTANMVDDATVATSSQAPHQQANVAVSKSERQKHADGLQHLHKKTTGSANGSAVVQPSVDSSKPLEFIRAAGSPSPKRQPVGDDGKSGVNDRHDISTDSQKGDSGQKASIKTSGPTNNAQSASKGKGKKQKATKASTRSTANNSSSSNNRQVEAAPAFNTKVSKGNRRDTTEGINSDPSHSKAGGRQSDNTKMTSKKAAGNTGTKSPKKPAVVEAEVNWNDGYLAAVRAVLEKAVGEPSFAQLQIAQSLAQLLKAVPAWMLTSGDANNQGCTAHAGLRAFQSALSGKRTISELQTVLRDVSQVKSMALLLRTVVAADVQSQLRPFPSSQNSDDRLMATEMMRLNPAKGMAELHKVPEWQLAVLHQKLDLALWSL